MKTIAIVSQKGGSGKTTIAVHLAVVASASGWVAGLVDTDPQATAAAWSDWRDSKPPEVITAPPVRLARTLQDMALAGAEVVIIDTPPHADAATREAVKLADLSLIPCRPRAFDLHAVQTTADLVRSISRPAAVVFNAAPPRAPSLLLEAGEVIKGLGLAVCPITISERAAFHQAAGGGKAAGESDPKGKANGEIVALWEWVCGQVHMSTRPQGKRKRT